MGLGALLGEKQEDESLQPIAYASRTLQSHEQNYGVTDGIAGVTLTDCLSAREEKMQKLMLCQGIHYKPSAHLLQYRSLWLLPYPYGMFQQRMGKPWREGRP